MTREDSLAVAAHTCHTCFPWGEAAPSPEDILLETQTSFEHPQKAELPSVDWELIARICTPKQTKILALRILGGYTYEEMGTFLGCTKQNTRGTYLRILKKLRDSL